jgi:formate/nitrite transporter FocA (FNT family)
MSISELLRNPSWDNLLALGPADFLSTIALALLAVGCVIGLLSAFAIPVTSPITTEPRRASRRVLVAGYVFASGLLIVACVMLTNAWPRL